MFVIFRAFRRLIKRIVTACNDALNQIGRDAECRFGPGGQAAKGAACAAYATQLGFQFGGPEGLAARLSEEGGVERFRREGDLPEGLGRILADVG